MQSLHRIPEQEYEPRLQFLVFQLGVQNFALEIHRVKEILRNADITPLPGTPSSIAGAIELRSKIIPIFDLRKRLGIAATSEPQNCRILIVTAARRIWGLIVDAVHRVVPVSPEDIQPAVSAGGNYVLAVLKVGSELLVIPDLDAIITSRESFTIGQLLPGN